MSNLGEAVAECVMEVFRRLPKRGKPQSKGSKVEWSILAGIVMKRDGIPFQCVSLGTGLKCLPGTKVPGTGDAVLDSHAEVLAKRAFRRYLYVQIKALVNGATSIFEWIPADRKDEVYQIRFAHPTPSFHLYISQAPCGDGSLETLAEEQTQISREAYDARATEGKRKRMEEGADVRGVKRRRGREDYEALGALRTKPGRSDSPPTLSMSCSDKLAVWTMCGIQGALLSLLLPPIYLSSICIGERYHQEALRRAIYDRVLPAFSRVAESSPPCPSLLHVSSRWEWGVEAMALSHPGQPQIPAAVSLCWSLKDAKAEVYNNGRKQGASPLKGTATYPDRTRPAVCKQSLASLFSECYRDVGYSPLTSATYAELKATSTMYQTRKSLLLKGLFQAWLGSAEVANSFDIPLPHSKE